MLRALRLLLVTFWPTLLARRRRGPLRPSWSFLFEWMVRYLRRDWDETAAWPLEQLRAAAEARTYPKPYLRRVRVRDEVLGGVPVRRFSPRGAPKGSLLFLHGGSYIYGSTKSTHANLVACLADASGLEVLGVEYRLAPEHRWPAQLEDALAVWGAVGGGPKLLAGDSAGGHLSVAATRALLERGQPPPTALVLLSPWVDVEMPGRSFVDHDPYDFGTRDVLVRQAQAVAGGLSMAQLSMAHIPLEGFPPTFVSVGGCELLRDDVIAFDRRLREAKVDCTYQEAVDMPHDPALFLGFHPAAQATVEATVRFLGRFTPSP